MSESNSFLNRHLAARFALGIATLDEMATTEARIQADPDFAAEVAAFDKMFSAFHVEPAPVSPSLKLWDRIESAIDDEAISPQSRTVRSGDMAWEPFLAGVDRKIIFADMTTGTSGVLYKVAPGANVGNHCHGVIEECLVLEGEIEVGGIVVRAGDMHIAFPGSRHGPLISRGGAVVYIRGDLQIQP